MTSEKTWNTESLTIYQWLNYLKPIAEKSQNDVDIGWWTKKNVSGSLICKEAVDKKFFLSHILM